MRIGICTVHYAHNYGAMLQGYALKTYLEGFGHEVVMVDSRRETLTTWDPRPLLANSFKSFLLWPKYLVKWYLPVYLLKKRRERRFEHFLYTFLDNKRIRPNEVYDVIVYGSDQIWSKFPYGFDLLWWGLDGPQTNKKISYAASMGVLSINIDDEPFIRKALSSFKFISVREEELKKEIVNRFLAPYNTVEVVLDPTFLLTKSQWRKLGRKRLIKEKYLLFYDFQADSETTEIAHFIADSKSLRLIRITDGVVDAKRDANYLSTAGPLEFISLCCYADFIITSSFHGTVFSILFEKQFYVRQIWNIERCRYLLSSIGLSSRFISDINGVNLNEIVDYKEINKRIKSLLFSSQSFLQKALM